VSGRIELEFFATFQKRRAAQDGAVHTSITTTCQENQGERTVTPADRLPKRALKKHSRTEEIPHSPADCPSNVATGSQL